MASGFFLKTKLATRSLAQTNHENLCCVKAILYTGVSTGR